MEETELDKSEQATPFKLRRAREKGSVARSMDLGFFAALVVAIGFFRVGAPPLASTIAYAAGETLTSAGMLASSPGVLGAVAARLVAAVAMPLLAFGGALFGMALALDFFQVGPVFSTTPLKPDFNRINPVSGFKRLFSFRMLVEALKATLKLGVYAVIAWLVISGMLAGKAAALTDSAQLATLLGAAVQRLLMFFALAALAFALIDQIYVRRDFARRMRMSRRELKREHRDREGEPRQKRKRRQLHGELAKAVSALRDVRGSDMIVINPVHYAVALRYDAGRMAAPSVTARGAGEMARRIKRIGFVYGVVMVNDPSLARALYRGGAIGSEIPPGLYAPVAAHYRRNGLGRKAAP